jgi:hypothetical protein
MTNNVLLLAVKTFEETFLNVARDIIGTDGVTYNETHWHTDRPISPTDEFRMSFLVQQLVHLLHANQTSMELTLPALVSENLPKGTTFERLKVENLGKTLHFLKVKQMRRLGEHALDIEAKWTILDLRLFVSVSSEDPLHMYPYMFFAPEPVSMILHLLTHTIVNATVVDVTLSKKHDLLAIPLFGHFVGAKCDVGLPMRNPPAYGKLVDVLEIFLTKRLTCLLHGLKED